MSQEEEEGPIENYEEFYNEIFEDYQSLVSVTRLPEFMLKEEQLPENVFKWGQSCGNILIKNASSKRPNTGLGTIFAEHWMIFPEDVEPAIVEALNGGSKSNALVRKCFFSLHTFTEVKISFTFVNPEASEIFRESLENGTVHELIVKNMRETGYEDELHIRYFNSDMTEEVK